MRLRSQKEPRAGQSEHCSTCRYWDARAKDESERAPEQGDCLRYPPSRGGSTVSSHAISRMGWPTTLADDWCGEHAARK